MKRIITSLIAAACVMTAACCGAFASTATANAVSASSSIKKPDNVKTVVFKTNLHCENCVKKVVENISYVKGVKDLNVSLEKQEISVKYDASKTSEEVLQKEIVKLGYPAVVKSRTE